MLGICLIALAAVIGLGFGIFSIAKGVSNEGTVNVQSQLEFVENFSLSQYNDTIVTGQMVVAAIKDYRGESLSILIHNTAMNKGVSFYNEHEDLYLWDLEELTYVNYNTLLSSSEVAGALPEKNVQNLLLVDEDDVYKEGKVVINRGFAIDSNGKVEEDLNIGGFTRSGNAEYIDLNSKYNANIIYDLSGVVIGLVFTQMD